MILLDDVVEGLKLAHQDRHVAAGVDRIDRRRVGAWMASLLCSATLSGSPFAAMTLSKKRFGAAMSRFAVNRK